jgi:hypothetical protein
MMLIKQLNNQRFSSFPLIGEMSGRAGRNVFVE